MPPRMGNESQQAAARRFRCWRENGTMIDVIGTDAGAPNSLPEALQDLLRQADFIAAPQRMQR